jgi:uncharacterized phage-associated protein
MKTNALSVANYFIDLAQKEGKPIHLLGLVKRVYIAHGFALALLGRGLLDPRFDKVEAWKYGPVIPSVYHSFKQYRIKPIDEQTVIMTWDEKNKYPVFNTPSLTDRDEKRVVEMVWKRYKEYSDNELVTLTHMKGTPWDMCFIKDENIAIPDILTENYYKKLVERIASRKGVVWKS